MQQFENQNGLGYLSQMPMNHRPLCDWQMSTERINEDEDYTLKNTVLEVLEFNHRSKWSHHKMEQIPSLIQTQISYMDVLHTNFHHY